MPIAVLAATCVLQLAQPLGVIGAAGGVPNQALSSPNAALPDGQEAVAGADCASNASAQSATPQPGVPVDLELILELNPAPGQKLDSTALLGIRLVLERRLELLDLSGEIRRRSDGRILVRIDATDEPDRIAWALASTMLVELIDPEGESLSQGTLVATTLGSPSASIPLSLANPHEGDHPVYETIISGADFTDVYVTESAATEAKVVAFELDEDAASSLYHFTSTHIGEPMAIVLDKRVITSPYINGAISTSGLIEGITPELVPVLVAQLKAGALSVPLSLVECRVVLA